MAAGAKLSTIVRSPHAYPTWNEDLTAASLEDLQASLARIRPLTRLLLVLRRTADVLRGRPRGTTVVREVLSGP
jgi:hypothetical protein